MNIHEILAKSLTPEALRLVQELRTTLSSGLASIWLVGGTVRDLLCGVSGNDIDFAFATDLTPQIKVWAQKTGGKWFWLDRQRRQSRVVFSTQGLQFDFAALRGADIKADLCLRDFTVNALALPLSDDPEIIDPLGGREDIANGILRSCGPGVLADDPLRIMKGIRHFAEYDWEIEARTGRQMIQAAQGLNNVAGERMKFEFARILRSERVIPALNLLSQYSIVPQLIPHQRPNSSQNPNHIDFTRTFAPFITRLQQLEKLPELKALLVTPIEEHVTLKALLLFARLLNQISDNPSKTQVIDRFRFSNHGRAILTRLCHSAPNSLETFTTAALPRLAALRVEQLGHQCVETLLYALASQQEIIHDSIVRNHIKAYLEAAIRGRIEHLLDGQTIMHMTGLRSGVEIGLWQGRIKAAEIAGEITTKSTAADWLKERFSD